MEAPDLGVSYLCVGDRRVLRESSFIGFTSVNQRGDSKRKRDLMLMMAHSFFIRPETVLTLPILVLLLTQLLASSEIYRCP